jgi:hypothetical protein
VTGWRRAEPKVVRPFFELADATTLLERAAIRLRADEDPVGGDGGETAVLDVDLSTVDPAEVRLLPNLDEADAHGVLGAEAEHYALGLFARDAIFKNRAALGHWPISDGLPREVSVDEETWHRYGHGRRLELTLALCLRHPREPRAGRPRTKGAWVARKTFELRPKLTQSLFALRPLTEDVAKDFKVPHDCLMHVDYDGRINEVDEAGVAVATCYLNEEVHERLLSGRRAPALNELVFAEVVSAILMEAGEDIRSAEAVIENSALDRVLSHLSKDDPAMTLDGLKQLLAEPLRLRAKIQATTGLAASLARM